MKDKLKIIFILTALVPAMWGLSQTTRQKLADREFYELRIYHYKDTAQEQVIDRYLSKSLLPAMHRSGIATVGVFKSLANDTSLNKKLILLLPMRSLDQVVKLQVKLDEDRTYQSSAKEWLEAEHNNPPYSRIESVILYAFSFMPKLEKPQLNGSLNDRIYELRSYESATTKAARNKIHMFNEGGEINLFKRLGFNAVFYGEVICGSQMPNLMYMTSFENKAERDAHWKAFGADPEWKKLSALPEYRNNVSHIDISFLRPTVYSDL
jgi:hypothetical protein